MPVPVIDPQKRSDAYKKVSPVDGITEQGLVPDPDVRSGLLPPVLRPALAPLFCFYTYTKPWWPPLMAARRQLLRDRCTM